MSDPHPDIFWIVTDEHRTDGIGAYGNPWIKTPNLDRLASEGVLFERAYCQSPACVASRASFLSGWYPHKTTNMWYDRTPDVVPFFPEHLQEAGYHTVNLGKENHHRRKSPFIQSMEKGRFREGGPTHLSPDFAHMEEELGVLHRYTTAKKLILAGTNPLDQLEAGSGYITGAAIDYLKRYDRQKPILLRLSLLYPHTPVLPPEPFDTMYDPEQMEFPTDGKESVGRTEFELSVLRQLGGVQGMAPEDIRRMRASYYGLCSYVDQQIGRFMSYLEENWDRPYLVVFHPDHGNMLGEHELHEKFNMYDPSTRVPFIMWGSGIPKGVRIGQFVELVDIAPTLMHYANLPMTEAMGFQGRNLLPLMENERIPWRDFAFTEHRIFTPHEISRHPAVQSYILTEVEGKKGYESARLAAIIQDNKLDWYELEDTPYRWWGPTFKCIRTREYALSVRPLWQEGQGSDWMGTLYDLSKDPEELNNVFDHTAYQETRQELISRLKTFDLETSV